MNTTSLIIAIVIASAMASAAQVRVPLALDKTAKNEPGIVLFCDKQYRCGLFGNETAKDDLVGGEKIKVKVERVNTDFYFWIDSNRNNSLTDEKRLLIKNGGAVEVGIRKRIKTGRPVYLPFEIKHSFANDGGKQIDTFFFHAVYVAAGTLKYRNCSAKIALSDMDQDGSFGQSDSARGTNLKVDRNNDGKFWGRGEFNRSEEIFEFCGKNFLVSRIGNSFIDFTPTNLRIAKVGETVPAFSITLTDGTRLTDKSLSGKTYVMDFWASWCIPCVKNLPKINELKKRYAGRIDVISINVDTQKRRALANKIIKDYGLSDISAVRGLGDKDPLWKVFGGANQNKLTIPLYVLVDEKGIVRYADSGGEGLSDLTVKIDSSFEK